MPQCIALPVTFQEKMHLRIPFSLRLCKGSRIFIISIQIKLKGNFVFIWCVLYIVRICCRMMAGNQRWLSMNSFRVNIRRKFRLIGIYTKSYSEDFINVLQLDWTSCADTQEINFPWDQEGCDGFEYGWKALDEAHPMVRVKNVHLLFLESYS